MHYRDTMLSQTLSLKRLQTYERECSRQVAAELEAKYKTDLSKLADAIQQRARELETILLDARNWFSLIGASV
jgi:hypothetical protein